MKFNWSPNYNARAEGDGPPRAFGYDGKYRPYVPRSFEWRDFYMRRARHLGRHTKAEWIALRDSYGFCVHCGADDVPLTKDHIHPVSRGGCDCIHNLQPLCSRCNSAKCAR